MPKNSIGDFLVTLGIDVDKNSFNNGIKQVDAVSVSLNKLIGTARNAAVVVAAYKGITGAVDQSKESLDRLNQSEIFGTSAEKLNVWRAAAKIAGADANGLIGSIGKLANVMNHMTIDGRGLESYSEQLAELGMGIDDLAGMDPADAVQKIFAEAQAQLDGSAETKLRMTTIIGDILGDAGQELFVTLARNNQSIANWLAGATDTQYQTNEGMQKSADFAVEINKLGETAKSIKNAIGDNLAGVLYTPVKNINQWFTDNKTKIANGIDKAAQAADKLVSGIGTWWENNGDIVRDTLLSIYTTMVAIFGWMTSEKGKGFFSGISNFNKTTWEMTKQMVVSLDQGRILTDGPIILENAIDDMIENILSTYKKVSGKTQDGILRPDGTLTQVAPDDWVFAVRNVSDLARAFVPQSMTTPAANQEYTINQTFNIQGGANDIPAVIKQQAYRGTQDALLQAMEQSSRRMQMMSGTR